MSEHTCHGCGADHDHDHDEMDQIIELTGDNGETIKVEFLATLNMEEKEYVVMRSVEAMEEEDGDIIIMRMEKDGDEDFLVSVDDDNELDQAFEAFKKLASEEYDFEEDEEEDEEE